jgi:hypothetical protein
MSPMRELRIIFSTAMIVVAAIGARPTAECVGVPGARALTIRQLMAQHDFVFTGNVIQSAPYSSDTLFEVDRVWKGRLHRHASFLIAAVGPQWAKPGHTYLMLLWQCRDCVGKRLIYEVGCRGGMDIENEETQTILKQLGPGKPPRD